MWLLLLVDPFLGEDPRLLGVPWKACFEARVFVESRPLIEMFVRAFVGGDTAVGSILPMNKRQALAATTAFLCARLGACRHITTHIKSIIHMDSESKSTTRHDAKSPEHKPKQKSPCRIGV